MALIERTVLAQVTVLPQQSNVNVQWLNQILRADEVIASTPHRKTYNANMKNEFLAEVDGAENYLAVLGW